jgi:hypothetical protein
LLLLLSIHSKVRTTEEEEEEEELALLAGIMN